MEFRTKIVVGRNNKKAYVAYAGLFIALSSLVFVFIPNMDRYIPWAFGTGIVVVVIGAVIARGDVTDYGLSEQDLTVSMRGITVGDQFYPLQSIRNMDFDVQAYEGMYVNDGAMVSGSNSDGMTNRLSFEAGGKKIACGFFLQNAMHVQQLGLLFMAFYEGHVPFIEHNKSTRTYLFQVLSASELEAFKKKYGYS
ncbi:MAG: hypothetical protein P4L51_23230 [Puia sp.]|nr:hypothetical protein [Puia sp.]